METFIEIKSLLKNPFYQLQFFKKSNNEDFFVLKFICESENSIENSIENLNKLGKFKFLDFDCDIVSYFWTNKDEKNYLKIIGVHFIQNNKKIYTLDLIFFPKLFSFETEMVGELKIILTYNENNIEINKIIENNIEYPGNDNIIYTLIDKIYNIEEINDNYTNYTNYTEKKIY
jgi:hypothetical protein